MRVQVTRRRNERGAVAILAALLALVLLGISAFTVDLGMAYVTKRQLSTASDAAALAADAYYKTNYQGLCTVPGNDPNNPTAANADVLIKAEAAADDLFTQNFPGGSNADGNITDLTCKGTGVQVTYTASGKSSSPFGPLLGGSGTITTAGTAAAANSVGDGICSLCVLGDVTTNNTDFTVDGGDIYVNGHVSTGPNSKWSATNSITFGSGDLPQANSTPDWTTGPPIPDPFASMTLPLPSTGMPNRSNPCGAQGPGIYGNASIGSGCVLQPGAYVITGTWQFGNKSTLSGNGVTLYLGTTGSMDFKNGGNIDGLVAPTGPPTGAPAGWPGGFAIIYDRTNPNDLTLQGNGDEQVIGNVYVPNGTITFNGKSCFRAKGGAIITKNVETVGQKSCLEVLDAKNAGNALPQNLRLTK